MASTAEPELGTAQPQLVFSLLLWLLFSDFYLNPPTHKKKEKKEEG
jgi:hypothetical protein